MTALLRPAAHRPMPGVTHGVAGAPARVVGCGGSKDGPILGRERDARRCSGGVEHRPAPVRIADFRDTVGGSGDGRCGITRGSS